MANYLSRNLPEVRTCTSLIMRYVGPNYLIRKHLDYYWLSWVIYITILVVYI